VEEADAEVQNAAVLLGEFGQASVRELIHDVDVAYDGKAFWPRWIRRRFCANWRQ